MFTDFIKTNFFRVLNRDLPIKEFEAWVYSWEARIQAELPSDLYFDLISFNYNQKDALAELEKKIRPFIETNEFDVWRTKELLSQIVNNEIDLVVATRKLRDLYYSTGEKLPIELGIGYESVLDDLPVPSEYDQWNKEELKEKLKKLDYYKEDLLQDAKSALESLNNE